MRMSEPLHTYCLCERCGATVRASRHSETDCETIKELRKAVTVLQLFIQGDLSIEAGMYSLRGERLRANWPGNNEILAASDRLGITVNGELKEGE